MAVAGPVILVGIGLAVIAPVAVTRRADSGRAKAGRVSDPAAAGADRTLVDR